MGQSSAFLRSFTDSNYCASSSSAILNPICIICSEHDVIKNVHATGAFYASKSKLNTKHVMKLTNNWRDIPVYIGNDALLNRLVIDDLGDNNSFYYNFLQLTYTIDLQKNRKKNARENLILIM